MRADDQIIQGRRTVLVHAKLDGDNLGLRRVEPRNGLEVGKEVAPVTAGGRIKEDLAIFVGRLRVHHIRHSPGRALQHVQEVVAVVVLQEQ